MPDPKDHQAFLNLCEMAIDNMYDLAAIGELLEQKGVLTKKEIIALAKELKRKTPATESHTASTIDTPPQQRFTNIDNAVIEEIMAARPIKPRRSYSYWDGGSSLHTRRLRRMARSPIPFFHQIL
jgi:predicted nucleic acid-binding protein